MSVLAVNNEPVDMVEVWIAGTHRRYSAAASGSGSSRQRRSSISYTSVQLPVLCDDTLAESSLFLKGLPLLRCQGFEPHGHVVNIGRVDGFRMLAGVVAIPATAMLRHDVHI